MVAFLLAWHYISMHTAVFTTFNNDDSVFRDFQEIFVFFILQWSSFLSSPKRFRIRCLLAFFMVRYQSPNNRPVQKGPLHLKYARLVFVGRICELFLLGYQCTTGVFIKVVQTSFLDLHGNAALWTQSWFQQSQHMFCTSPIHVSWFSSYLQVEVAKWWAIEPKVLGSSP